MTDHRVDALIIYHIHRISRQWGRQSALLYEREFGLKLSEVWVLQLIGEFPDATMSRLTEHSHMDKAAISRAVGGLERKGLVERLADPEDRRLFRLNLTKAGLAIHARVLPLREARQRRLEDSLDAEDRAALFRAFDKIYAQLAEDAADD